MNPSRDDLTIQRYVDGELSEPEAAAFAARLLQEPALREQVDQLREFAGGLAVEEAPRAPAGFTAKVHSCTAAVPLPYSCYPAIPCLRHQAHAGIAADQRMLQA